MPKIKDKEIIKLEANEVSDILNVAENGSSYLTKHQEAYHEVTHIRDTALLTLFWARVFVFRSASDLT